MVFPATDEMIVLSPADESWPDFDPNPARAQPAGAEVMITDELPAVIVTEELPARIVTVELPCVVQSDPANGATVELPEMTTALSAAVDPMFNLVGVNALIVTLEFPAVMVTELLPAEMTTVELP